MFVCLFCFLTNLLDGLAVSPGSLEVRIDRINVYILKVDPWVWFAGCSVTRMIVTVCKKKKKKKKAKNLVVVQAMGGDGWYSVYIRIP